MENKSTLTIKQQFDQVLVKHLTRLLEVNVEAITLSFSLANISCLLLLVDRENEIKSFPESPPERYTRESFLDDLAEVGMAADEDLLNSTDELAQYGYINIGDDDRYYAQISAFALVSFLDNLFPGMPGMSFVAYIIQTMEEVVSGRKALDDALNQFDQTLFSRGVSLSKQNIEAPERVQSRITAPKKPEQTQEIARQKKINLEKLQKIRSATAGETAEPRVYTHGSSTRKIKITELYPRQDEDEIVAYTPGMAPAARQTPVAPPADAPPPAPAAPPPDSPVMDQMPSPAPPPPPIVEADIEEEETSSTDEREAEAIDEIEPEEIPAPKAEERANPLPSTVGRTSGPLVEDPEYSIEKQIAAFESEIDQVPCPICGAGFVTPHDTERGKRYFACNSNACKFISWGMPYHYPCPKCGNSFLIEFADKDGQDGLKCAKATCTYRQNHLDEPQRKAPSAPAGDDPAPKKRKVVRRVVRRKK